MHGATSILDGLVCTDTPPANLSFSLAVGAMNRRAFQPMYNRAGPQTEKWENLSGTKFFCCLVLAILCFFDISTSFSLEHGPFFST